MDRGRIRSSGIGRGLSTACLTVLMVVLLGAVSAGAAEPEVPEGFQLGKIPGLSATLIQIDGINYRLSTTVDLKDEVGREWKLEDIGPEVYVMYHVNEDKLVDQIIIVLPR